MKCNKMLNKHIETISYLFNAFLDIKCQINKNSSLMSNKGF